MRLVFKLLMLGLLCSAQTKTSSDEAKWTVTVIEWAKCTGKDTASPPKWDCRGLELYRFRLADGSVRGPFIALPAPAGFVQDAKWQNVPLVTSSPELAGKDGR